MQSKSLLIAIAAFAVTATGVHAYAGTKAFEKAGLTEEQISAFETARTLKKNGDVEAARDVLIGAGVDDTVLRSVHHAARANREALEKALENNDYEAFKDAVEGTPLADVVNTEADFKKFAKAHELKLSGKWPEAKKILDELGLEPQHRFPGMHRGMMRNGFQDLTDNQREALRVAHQANDKEAAYAILEDAGVTMMGHRGMHW